MTIKQNTHNTTFYHSNGKQARAAHSEVQSDNCLVADIFRLLSQIGAAPVQMGDKECLCKVEPESADFPPGKSAIAAVAVGFLRSGSQSGWAWSDCAGVSVIDGAC